ncbi:hypothetical protein TB1_034978 [Malus domestica]
MPKIAMEQVLLRLHLPICQVYYEEWHGSTKDFVIHANNTHFVASTLKKMEHEQREAQVSKAIAEAKDLVSAIESQGMKLGKAMYRELTGLRKPVLDKNNTLLWPVLLLYAEVMSSDFIEDFCETDMLSAHLNVISFF